MSRLAIWSLTILCILPMAAAVAAEMELEEPSACAAGMPGASGTFSFRPADHKAGETTYWKDTDGIAPEIAGCHFATDESGVPNGRMFGEACLPNGLLVESNPGAYVLHSHEDDTGHPDTFDCNAWCVGRGAAEGICATVFFEEGFAPCRQSARCVCN